MTARQRAAAIAAVVVASIVVVAAARESSLGSAELAQAQAAAAKADWPGAILHARAAAEAVAPASPWPERGLSRLEAIGKDAEARGDEETALLAYGALRAAAIGARSPWSSRSEWRSHAESGLARIAATGDRGGIVRSGAGARASTPAGDKLEPIEEMKSALENAH